MATGERIKLFYVYSRVDQKLRDELANHLNILRQSCDIESWHDGEIIPGTNWEAEISNRLNTANITLLLVSVAFLNSFYCRKEMDIALDRYDRGEAWVIPVIMSPVAWEEEGRLKRLQVLPTGGVAVQKWGDQQAEAFVNITLGVKSVITQINNIEKIEEYINDGRSHDQNGRVPQAINAYEQALKHIKANLNLSEFHRAQTNPLSSEADVLHILGDLYAKNRDFERALARYEQALQIAVDNPVIYLEKGHVLYELRRFVEAIDAYDQALRLGANQVQIYINKGSALIMRERYAEASEAYRAAISKDPGNARLHADLGETLKRQGKPLEALHSYQEAKRLNPTHIRYCVNTCKLLISLGNFKDALTACEDVIALKKEDPLWLVEYGKILYKLERFEKAVDIYTRAIDLQRDNRLFYELRSQVLEACAQRIKDQREKLEKQEKYLRERIKEDKKQAELLKRKRKDEGT